ncbi:ABC transporter substrate-binding protein [Pontibacter sp. CAU 1760]
MRVRLAIEPETLSPINHHGDAGSLQILNLLFQSLLSADLADDQIKPYLAAEMPEMERTDSTTLFSYQLRDEAVWTDGSPVTAADVAFTLKVMKAPLLNNESLKPQVQFIRDIRLDEADPKRFTLVCDGYSPEMELLTGDFFILPTYLLDPNSLLLPLQVADLNESLSKLENNKELQAFAKQFNSPTMGTTPALLQGSGGYVLENWESGRYLTLKQKENWWGNTLPEATHLTANPERISFQVIPDNTTALLALKNRQLDVLETIPAPEFDRLKADPAFKKDYALYAPDAYEFIFAGLNSRLPKLADKRTRQAIAHLLDVKNIIKASQQSYATPTVGPVPPSLKTFYHAQLQPYTYNVQQATALLAAAGWEKEADGWYQTLNGKREKLTLEIAYRAGNTSYENTAIIFQQSAAAAGIPVEVRAMENSLLVQQLKSQTFELYLRSLSGNPFVLNFEPLFHTRFAQAGGMNTTGFGTEESDTILEAINKAETPEVKAKLLKRLQEILHEEATFLSLFYLKERLAVHRRFGNLKISGLKPNYDVSAFTLKE